MCRAAVARQLPRLSTPDRRQLAHIMTQSNESLPLAGIRVVEFTHMVMGPTCGMILADLGAEVIKVEPPGGDKTR
ncbi:CoA transferase, partial [Salmonella enterica]|uniref:CoA transferase n=1 Tax=Salmonella enterica TaxID=28901 RepID=UPI002814B165